MIIFENICKLANTLRYTPDINHKVCTFSGYAVVWYQLIQPVFCTVTSPALGIWCDRPWVSVATTKNTGK